MSQNIENTVIVALDFETAGFYKHSACSLGMCRIENLQIAREYSTLIKPPERNIRFSHIHGLYWKDLRNQKDFSEVWSKISSFLEGADFLMAHNASFDRSVLQGTCNFFHLPVPRLSFICTLKGSRKKLSLRSNSLESVCQFLNIPLNHHKADSDARACAQIGIYLLQQGLDIKEMLLQ